MLGYFRNKYPHLFDEDLINFDCGDGWKDLVDKALGSIKEGKVRQLKEKFGGLRLYMDGISSADGNVISEAERESFKICEMCGTKEGVTTEGSWIKTLCGKCREFRHKCLNRS